MKFLEVLFGKSKLDQLSSSNNRINVHARAQGVILGTDKKSAIIHKKANLIQREYLKARKKAVKIKKDSEDLIKHLDTLSAVAIATGGKDRGFKP